MVGIVCSSSFQRYYIHGSRMYITHIKRISRYPKTVLGVKLKVVSLKMTKNMIPISRNKSMFVNETTIFKKQNIQEVKL